MMNRKLTKQIIVGLKIRSVSAASAWRADSFQATASLAVAKRRRDGSAWGWGPARTRK